MHFVLDIGVTAPPETYPIRSLNNVTIRGYHLWRLPHPAAWAALLADRATHVDENELVINEGRGEACRGDPVELDASATRQQKHQVTVA